MQPGWSVKVERVCLSVLEVAPEAEAVRVEREAEMAAEVRTEAEMEAA